MTWTPDEMMTIAAARRLRDRDVCFVGIGLPSAACNLARLTHAPELVLIYESGTVGARPTVLPLSIGDGELAIERAFALNFRRVRGEDRVDADSAALDGLGAFLPKRASGAALRE